MTAVYTIWESEDEGFRMPSPTHGDGFRNKVGATLAAAKVSGGHLMEDWERYQDELSIPNGHGDVVAVFSDSPTIKTMEDALKELDGDVERLYAMDWTFVLKITAW